MQANLSRNGFPGTIILALVLASCGDTRDATGPYGTAKRPLSMEQGDDDGGGGQPFWAQWGRDPRHDGSVPVAGQRIDRQLADTLFDPFVSAEQAEEGGELLTHYQVPLLGDDDVFMEFKTGSYVSCSPPGSGTPFPCGPDAWNAQIWNERRLHWEGGRLVQKWSFASDWKPEPDAGGLGGWEPVFHAVLANRHVYVPGAGGTVFKLDRRTGRELSRINPFGVLDAEAVRSTFVAGPLAADAAGNIYYNAIKLDVDADPAKANPWGMDVLGAWLVRIAPDGGIKTATFASLAVGAPGPTDLCAAASFTPAELPWPPSPTAMPAQVPCGGQRPGINVTPAIAPDGTIYTVSRSHFLPRHGFLLAVNPDLSARWAASLRGRLNDGCGSAILPPNGTPGGCRSGANFGVDPATNEPPAGLVIDLSSSSPAVAPDGSILYGAYTRYNYARGHLFKFSPSGDFLGAYDFGWDTTPAIHPSRSARHPGDYSIVLKDNHYNVGSYCFDPTLCPAAPPGPYYITQLGADLSPQWRFQNTNTQSCQRNQDGTLTCVSDHPGGFEWCINAPAVDDKGVVYANSEDGNLYTLDQGGTLRQRLFLNLALGAAYTPLAIGQDGRIFTENDGDLFVIGR